MALMICSDESRPFIQSLAMLVSDENTCARFASSCRRSGWVLLSRIDTQNGSRDSTPCQSTKTTRPDSGS